MIISESIVINAPISKVWHTLADLSCWKDWNTAVSNLSSDTERLTEGGSFRFCIRPFTFPVNIETFVEEVIPGRRIVWSGSRHGIRARHEFHFDERNGNTLLTSREIFRLSLMKRLLFHIPKKRLHELSILMLRDLKYAAENSSLPENISESEIWEKRSE